MIGCGGVKTYYSDLLERHKIFGVTKRITIPKNDSIYIIADQSNFTKTKLIFLPPSIEAFEAGPLTINFFANPTFTPGTEWYLIDRNQYNASAAQTRFFVNSSVDDEGILVPSDWYVFSNGSPSSSIQGGLIISSINFVAQQGVNYMFKYTNTDTLEDAITTIAFLVIEL